MALIKYKPRTPGTRALVKVDRSHLHKGGPRMALTAHQHKTGGRNHFGRITTRHKGGGSGQKYRIIDFKRDKDGEGKQGSIAKRWSRRTGTSVGGKIESRGVGLIYPVGGEPGARAKIGLQ
jgi:ribosomal protein L2